jgi:putative transposase
VRAVHRGAADACGGPGRVRRGRRTRTTIPATRKSWPPDLVNRNFHAEAPNRLWVVDIT